MEPEGAIIGCRKPHTIVTRPMRCHRRACIVSVGTVAVRVIVLRLRVRTRPSRSLLCDSLIVGERVRAHMTVVSERHAIPVLKARGRGLEHWRRCKHRRPVDGLVPHHVATHGPRRTMHFHWRLEGRRTHRNMGKRLGSNVLTVGTMLTTTDNRFVCSGTPFRWGRKGALRHLGVRLRVEVARPGAKSSPGHVLLPERAILIQVDLQNVIHLVILHLVLLPILKADKDRLRRATRLSILANTDTTTADRPSIDQRLNRLAHDNVRTGRGPRDRLWEHGRG